MEKLFRVDVSNNLTSSTYTEVEQIISLDELNFLLRRYLILYDLKNHTPIKNKELMSLLIDFAEKSLLKNGVVNRNDLANLDAYKLFFGTNINNMSGVVFKYIHYSRFFKIHLI